MKRFLFIAAMLPFQSAGAIFGFVVFGFMSGFTGVQGAMKGYIAQWHAKPIQSRIIPGLPPNPP